MVRRWTKSEEHGNLSGRRLGSCRGYVQRAGSPWSRSVKNQEGTRKRLGLKWTELERGGNCLGNRMQVYKLPDVIEPLFNSVVILAAIAVFQRKWLQEDYRGLALNLVNRTLGEKRCHFLGTLDVKEIIDIKEKAPFLSISSKKDLFNGTLI